MKRVKIEIEEVASFGNLALAAVNAAKGKRHRQVVQRFFERFYQNISHLRSDILSHKAPVGRYKVFYIFDPKRRRIFAPCFRDRVVHHALINLAGQVFDKALVDSTYACRVGKGPLMAVNRVKLYSGKYPWFVKIDIKKYFDSIDHGILKDILKKRIKGHRTFDLIGKIIDAYHTVQGKGLPMGALTSQYFANYYLNNVDRFILKHKDILGHTRYMDDIVWWCRDKASAKETYKMVKAFIERSVLLETKENYQINRTANGLTFCGFRVFADSLRLTRRKKVRYTRKLRKWEDAYQNGIIDENKLQSAYSSVHSIISHTDSLEWRKRYFKSKVCKPGQIIKEV